MTGRQFSADAVHENDRLALVAAVLDEDARAEPLDGDRARLHV